MTISSGKKVSTNGCFRLHIYLCTEKLTHNSLYVFENLEKKLSHKKTQYSYSKEMFTGRTKPLRIIDEPDNQRPDKWISTVRPDFSVTTNTKLLTLTF